MRNPAAARHHVVVIGAGPAGLTAAYELTKRDIYPTVLEADTVVGGISRTVERDGWRFDIGGHRFFTKVKPVEELWHEILEPGDFLLRPRMSRIYYDGKFFDYPLKAANALRNLGVTEAIRCVLSYVRALIRPPKDQSTFAGWTTARFGKRLYGIFFKTYTEKVWGVPAAEIQADWAAQRIKNLSLAKAVWRSVRPGRSRKQIASLIDEFEYPRLGPGMMWERCHELVEKGGGTVLLGARAASIRHADGRAVGIRWRTPDGKTRQAPVTDVISTMPLPELLRAMDPPVPAAVQMAADDITFRDFLSVALVIPDGDAFPDNWIYVHSPTVKLGRIQNYGSWSPEMVKPGKTCLGLEYFVFEGDELWEMSDDDLVAFGIGELVALGLVKPDRVEAGYVVRMPKAYPIYDEGYREKIEVMRRWLAENAANVHPVGRNGMHKYNNQDHSMYTAMLTVENIADGTSHDVWAVNVEDEYHEEVADAGGSPQGTEGGGRDAPILPRRRPVRTGAAAGAERGRARPTRSPTAALRR